MRSSQRKSGASTILSNFRRTQVVDGERGTSEKTNFSVSNADSNGREPTTIHVQKLKRKVDSAESEIRRLRSERDQSMRQIRDELSRDLQQKVTDIRQKTQREKEKALQANTAHLRSCYEEKLEGIVKIKDKEIRSLESQMRKTQEKLYASISRLGVTSPKSQDSLKFPPKYRTNPPGTSIEGRQDSSSRGKSFLFAASWKSLLVKLYPNRNPGFSDEGFGTSHERFCICVQWNFFKDSL